MSCQITGIGIELMGRTRDGLPIVNFGLRYGHLTLFAGGGLDRDSEELLERQMWIVPPAGVLALQSLAAMYGNRSFSARQLYFDARDGRTRPLLDAFGDRLETPEDCGRFLRSLVEYPPESAYRLQQDGPGYRVARTPGPLA